jgi:tetratricopeptide (TPR) repeat protein
MQEYFHHDLFNTLERNDFIRFASEFLQAIYVNIPTLQSVTFLDPVEPQPADSLEESDVKKGIREATQEATDSGRPVLTSEALYLPFSVENTTIIAELKGLDEYLVRKVGHDWLNALQPLLLREFHLIKRANIDSLTGLLSSLHLNESLNVAVDNLSGVLVLLSVFPKGSNAFYARSYLKKNVSLLKGFINERYPLYYLGQSCFAMICKDTDQNFSSEFAPLLLNFFKREGGSHVHVATLNLAQLEVSSSPSRSVSEFIMKKAWAALHIASKRGPFAFCNASVLENLAAHPLAPPAKQLKRWLLQLTRNCNSFSLLQFTRGDASFLERIRAQARSKGEVVTAGDNSYLFLPTVDRKKLKAIAEKIIAVNTLQQPKDCISNVGIAIYSKKERFKSDTLLNCKKALCHAAFLEPGSVVICDAVSFNISGDIYYGDGDLVRAVTEYKRGLQLKPKDGNLLNSLGVCYAQMNRHKDAVFCFEWACKSKNDRFMALYNLGFELQQQRDTLAAIKSFNDALSCPETENQEVARKDICFQLSVLCCQQGLYKEGLALLQPWYDKEQNGKALKYLGGLYSGLDNYKKAMKYLQLAIRYDEYDAEVLGLLGEIYLQENEGDDIALRFCEKAVELNPDSLNLKIRLAKAQTHCGDLAAAGKTLQPCLRNKKTRLQALQQKVILANELGNGKTAAKWHAKAEQLAATI